MSRDSARGEITDLLSSWRDGDRRSVDRLFGLVYDQLRLLAHRQLLRSGPGGALSTTALVHEGYLKMVDRSRVAAQDRAHFFAIAATAMRQILIDQARRASAQKRGGESPRAVLPAVPGPPEMGPADLLALEEALASLEALDPRLGKLVELRFFAGLSVDDVAETMGLSARTVKRDWHKARAFLYDALTSGPGT